MKSWISSRLSVTYNVRRTRAAPLPKGAVVGRYLSKKTKVVPSQVKIDVTNNSTVQSLRDPTFLQDFYRNVGLLSPSQMKYSFLTISSKLYYFQFGLVFAPELG